MKKYLSNLKHLKADMESKCWVISCFVFAYHGISYLVLVILYPDCALKPDPFALVRLRFVDTGDPGRTLDVAANSCHMYISGRELRRFFRIEFNENLGDLFAQFYFRLGKSIPKTAPTSYTPAEKMAMVNALSESDSEDPAKIYCTTVRHNPLKADGTPAYRSAFNTAKARLLRPALYDLLKEDPTISFCFSTDPLQERDDNTILSSWAGR